VYSTRAALAGVFVNKMHNEPSEDVEFRRSRQYRDRLVGYGRPIQNSKKGVKFMIVSRFTASNTYAFVALVALLFTSVSCSSSPSEPVADPLPVPAAVIRGQELVVGLAACGFCHGVTDEPQSTLSGGRNQYDRYGKIAAPNITPAGTGLKGWEMMEVVQAIRQATGKDSQELSDEVHAGFQWLSDDDAIAIAAYLRVIPAIENQVERRSIGFLKRNTLGFFDVRRSVAGYVPAIANASSEQYGRYLVNHVARCTSCHNTPATLLSSEGYLTGGQSVQNDLGDKIAPDITASPLYGIGDWSQAQIVSYLRSGNGPKGGATDPHYCPTKFFALAADQDLEAIAIYLRTVQNN